MAIFSTAPTLEKIRYITFELEAMPGIDRYKIVSLASRKLKNPKITSWGMEATCPHVAGSAQTDKDMQKLKDAIYSNEAYYGSYVSLDSKKSLIFADFFEERRLTTPASLKSLNASAPTPKMTIPRYPLSAIPCIWAWSPA